ncbi:MAG: 2-C-methyl-D-erythritol 2,4-cyclodiphosphate synthase [Chlorobi bacterium]|nr:MAG: 2C-Methyl-D-erythritol 2,4-cyclodiphosphate synthase [Chlorobi bacterium OLB7]MBK8911996.1 2-C-methyl-D-erythritol 2,4-cyclodiphosphate synthase [Chlorobiota bacterium]
MLSGFGYDVHRLEAGRPLRLGGVDIPDAPAGPIAHSDGDVILHALCDALLGAAALGDIGRHFPDTDPRWSGANSVELLAAVVALLRGQQLRPNNVDCMVLLERPKIAPFREQMRETIAATLGISIQRVSVKATTHEGLGPIGAGEGVAAYAVATVVAATADQPNAQP